MTHLTSAIFLDRDGTINIDHGYVHTIDDFHFIDGVIETCRELIEMGFALVLVTNQSGIARGKYSEEQFLQLTEWMDWSLADRQVDLAAIYYCPHHATEGKGRYKKHCDCRKPLPGMLLSAQQELAIDMTSSYIVGDKIEDIQAGIAAGIGTKVLVKTGKAITDKGEALADWVLDSLNDLPAKIKQRRGK